MRRQRSRLVRILRVWYRRGLLRMDRRTPEWLRWAMPWGTSLSLHGLFLVLLAIFVIAQRPGGDSTVAMQGRLDRGEDLTSLAPGDRSGDPFTKLDSDEPPSLALSPADIDPMKSNQPELPPNFRLGPDIQLTPPGGSTSAPKSAAGNATAAGKGEGAGAGDKALMAPFSGRSAAEKAKLVRREGGSVKSEAAVERGLDWIFRHQRKDGGWSLDTTGLCPGNAICPPVECVDSDTGAVGLALLPMLAAGHSHTEAGPYKDCIDRGLRWIVRAQRKDGDTWVGGGAHTHLYSHAIATMALCEAYGLTRDPRLKDPAQRAVNFIVNSRDRLNGGWRYEPGAPGDTSVLGWQMMALRSARLAGLTVSKRTISDCVKYLNSAAVDEDGVFYCYMPGLPLGPTMSMTAEALLCRQYLGWDRDTPALVKGAGQIAAHLRESRERNIYYWYYATQLLHNMKGKDWEEWNGRIREGLIGLQVAGTGCDRGSWDPLAPQPDRWGSRGGRLFQTSLSILTLEVYYRYLPLYRDDAPMARIGTPEAPANRPPPVDEAPTGSGR
ncbi:MAG TPA: prenyltransferase/squalene oxidase repeat-containing protein [Isosphaeraceae bacterium]|jgi:hypothetical protein|nr:prenyltransferase/squalene oxidase repeat-containing protein [Isosphaeraceae bacterium]